MDDAPGGSTEPADLILLPEAEARRASTGRALSFAVLAPPYPALGVGALRVLRIAAREGAADLVAGYESYIRLDRPEAG